MIGQTDPSQPTPLRDTWLSQMPQLMTQLGDQDGSETWRARTSSGAEVLARRVALPATMAPDAYIDRLRRVHQAQAQHLAFLVGAVERDDGVWVLYRPMAAVPLHRLLGVLDPARGLSLGLGVLSGLATLHWAGLGQRPSADNVQVDTMGLARLDGTWLPVDEAEARIQVREAGRLLCQLLGVPEQPTQVLAAAERQTPALAAAVRSMAAGSTDDAATALAVLREAAGGLSAQAQLARTQRQVADLARQLLGGREIEVPQPEAPRPVAPITSVPSAPPPARNRPKAAPVVIGPRPTRESTWKARPPAREGRRRLHPGVLVAGGLVALLLVVVAIGALRAQGGPQPSAGTYSPASSAPPTGRATQRPATPTPSSALPASAGDIKQVELTFDQVPACGPGDRACQLRVQVDTNSLPSAQTLAWVFQVTDLCTGKTVQAPGSSVDAAKGWTNAWGISIISIPQGKRIQIVAQTTQPAVAGSSPLVIGAQSC